MSKVNLSFSKKFNYSVIRHDSTSKYVLDFFRGGIIDGDWYSQVESKELILEPVDFNPAQLTSNIGDSILTKAVHISRSGMIFNVSGKIKDINGNSIVLSTKKFGDIKIKISTLHYV